MHLTATSLAAKLQRVLDAQESIDGILGNPSNFEGELVGCICGLQHFAADADMRAKDIDYRHMQEHEMHKLIRLLLSGAVRSELERVHFLGASSG